MYMEIWSIYTVYTLNQEIVLLRTKPTDCQLIFILTAGNMMAAAFTSAVKSTPSGALQHKAAVSQGWFQTTGQRNQTRIGCRLTSAHSWHPHLEAISLSVLSGAQHRSWLKKKNGCLFQADNRTDQIRCTSERTTRSSLRCRCSIWLEDRAGVLQLSQQWWSKPYEYTDCLPLLQKAPVKTS